MKTIILQVIISHFINILYLRITTVPPKTLVSSVQGKFCRAQILGLPALILDLNLTLPPRVYRGEYTWHQSVPLTELNLSMQARDLERMERL